MKLTPQLATDLARSEAASSRYETELSYEASVAAFEAWQHVAAHHNLLSVPVLYTRVQAELGTAIYAHFTRYPQPRPTEVLEKAIALLEQVLPTAPDDHPRWPRWYTALGLAFRERSDIYGRVADLNSAIEVLQLAARRTKDQSPYWASLQVHLGNALRRRFDVFERKDDLDSAIAYIQHALSQTERSSLQWATRRHDLAASLSLRGKKFAASADLDQAIAILQNELRTLEIGTVNWTHMQYTLGIALARRFELKAGKDVIDSAIAAFQAAIATVPPNYLNLTALHGGLALALDSRYTAFGLVADLHAAIEEYRQLTNDVIHNVPDRVIYYNGLGAGVLHRFQLLKQQTDLDEAISAFNIGLKLVERDHAYWAALQHQLGVALSERFKVFGRMNDIDAAVRAFQNAASASRSNSPDWAMRTFNFGSALEDRYKAFRLIDDLNAAISAYKQAITVSAPSTPDWARWHVNLGSALFRRFNVLFEEASRRVIHGERQPASARTEWDGVFEEALRRYNPSAYGDAEEGLIVALRQAIYAGSARKDNDWDAGIMAYRTAIDFYAKNDWPTDELIAAYDFGITLMTQFAWNDAVQVFERGVHAADRLIQAQLLEQEREAWMTKATNIHRYLAYALARTGRLEDAVLALEQGRARGLSTALVLDAHDLDPIRASAPTVYQAYVQAAQQVRELIAQERTIRLGDEVERPALTSPEGQEKVSRIRTNLVNAIADVRKLPGYEQFPSQASFAEVAAAVESGVPVVYLFSTPLSTLTLVVHYAQRTVVKALWAREIATDTFGGLVSKHEGHHTAEGAVLRNLTAYQLSVLPLVGEQLVRPLAEYLRGIGATGVTLIPGAFFGLLPVHAAPYDVQGQVRCLIDEFDVMYAPSAHVLNTVRQRPGRPEQHYVGLGNPQYTTSWTDLLAVEVAGLLGGKPLLHNAATAENLIQQVKSAAPAHVLLGCHGQYDVAAPLRSGLDLADGRLTLARIVNEVSLQGTDLVMLCACETGLYESQQLPDEVIGLPAGFLQVGAKAVIASLWKVDTLPTVLLLRQFYRHLAQGVAAARALRESASWLRGLNHAQYEEAVSAIVAIADSPTAFKLEQEAAKYHHEHPFAAPMYWAAFTYSGLVLPGGLPDVA